MRSIDEITRALNDAHDVARRNDDTVRRLEIELAAAMRETAYLDGWKACLGETERLNRAERIEAACVDAESPVISSAQFRYGP